MHEICKYHREDPEIMMTRMPIDSFMTRSIPGMRPLIRGADPARGGTRVHARRWDIMSPARIPRAAVLEYARGAGASALGHHESPTGILEVPALGLNVRFEST